MLFYWSLQTAGYFKLMYLWIKYLAILHRNLRISKCHSDYSDCLILECRLLLIMSEQWSDWKFKHAIIELVFNIAVSCKILYQLLLFIYNTKQVSYLTIFFFFGKISLFLWIHNIMWLNEIALVRKWILKPIHH